MQRKRNAHSLLVGLQIDAAALKNSMEVLKKKKNRTAIRSSNFTSRYLS